MLDSANDRRLKDEGPVVIVGEMSGHELALYRVYRLRTQLQKTQAVLRGLTLVTATDRGVIDELMADNERLLNETPNGAGGGW